MYLCCLFFYLANYTFQIFIHFCHYTVYSGRRVEEKKHWMPSLNVTKRKFNTESFLKRIQWILLHFASLNCSKHIGYCWMINSQTQEHDSIRSVKWYNVNQCVFFLFHFNMFFSFISIFQNYSVFFRCSFLPYA